MKYTLSTDNIELGASDIDHLEQCFRKLKPHLQPPYLIEVRVRHDRHHRKGQVVTCTIKVKAQLLTTPFHVERSADTFATACDQAVNVVDHELSAAHDKDKKSHRGFQE